MKIEPKARSVNMRAYGISAGLAGLGLIGFVWFIMSSGGNEGQNLKIPDDVYQNMRVDQPPVTKGYAFLQPEPPPVQKQETPPPSPVQVQTPPPPYKAPSPPARKVGFTRPATPPQPPQPMPSFAFGESNFRGSPGEAGQLIKAQFSPNNPPTQGAGRGGDGGQGIDRSGISPANRQQRDFLKGSDAGEDYVTSPWMAPISDYMLRASTMIFATSLNAATTDLPNSLAAQITRDVRDSIHGECVLIPAMSILFGETNDQVRYGQDRSQVRWRRILFPDGSSQNLGSMAGTDEEGMSGVEGHVNHHYVPFFAAIFGDAALKMLAQSGQFFQDGGNNEGQVNIGYAGAGAFGNSVSNAMDEVIRKELDRPNTIELHKGDQIGLMLTKDVALPPYNNCED